MHHLIAIPIMAIAFLANAACATVPLSWDATGHVVVPTVVNGKGPFAFLVDTGADESAVYSWFAKSLDLPKGKQRELSGATGSEEMTATLIESLAVDGRTMTHVDADTIPDRVDGARIAGVVGVDLMRHRLAAFDFACGTFALRPLQRARTDIAGTGATLIKAGSIRDGHQLTLPATVNGIAGVAVLDTGSRYTFINRKYAEAAGISTASTAFHDANPTRGATRQSVTARIGPIGTVRFAGITRQDVVARVVDLPVFKSAGLADHPSMILGLDLLHDTRLTFDYSSRQFWLAQSSCASPASSNAQQPAR